MSQVNKPFHIQKPVSPALHFVESYFYLDVALKDLSFPEEYVLPFPRITFGYFFDHPFLVTNHTRLESKSANMIISRITTDQVTVLPLTDHIRILGAHLKPYGLAYLTSLNLAKESWLIDTKSLLGTAADTFEMKLNTLSTPQEYFQLVEESFLSAIQPRDLSLVQQATDLIENDPLNITVSGLTSDLHVNERTLRLQFERHIGCSPKELIQLYRLKQAVSQMAGEQSLTQIAHSNLFFDQAHFIKSIRNITGKSPGELRKLLHTFRFLQF